MFLKSGACYKPTSQGALDLHVKLPPGTYVVRATMEDMFLEKVEDFALNFKLYGSIPNYTARILKTFANRSLNTGVLLSGEKGSGKTLLAKSVAINSKLPTILVNAPFVGDKFNTFLAGIEQPAVVLFDEFEKVYADPKDQQLILTLLDGVFPSKKLFLITCNDKYKVNAQMKNRPGRIFYLMEFEGMEPEAIREYCNDNLKEKKYIDRIIQIASTFDTFNFDMLKALVEEMNRYNEAPGEALRMLNVKAEFAGPVLWSIAVYKNGTLIPSKEFTGIHGRGEIVTNPLLQRYDLYWIKKAATDTGDEVYENITVWPRHIVSIENHGHTYTSVVDDYKIVLDRKKAAGGPKKYMEAEFADI